ncbi:hypothetical protein [Frankia sp. Cj3]|uniref:hypothetical protein n=1 Tax=Frankia sp. Cj3 TaxID=2880976 RepID=UPI001EF4A0D8|nr:hypothetical protein [Frankia sp. Cj3]
MSDPWATVGLSRDMVVDGALAHWQEFRRGVSAKKGNHRFQQWLFGELAEHSTEHDHTFGLFEIAIGVAGHGLIDDAFLVLGWLAERYAGHQNPDLAWRVIMGLTDDCVYLASDSPKHNSVAQRILREVVDRAGTSTSLEVERATCRALVQIAMLRSIAGTPWDTRRAHIAEVWTEVARRWQGSADPELHGRVAQALVNLALLALQFDDEPAARHAFAEIILRFGDAPSGLDGDLDRWVTVACYANRVLDRIAFTEPEFQLDYLRRQRHWYPESDMEGVVGRARRVHTRSAGTVRSWACTGQPFVLLLRNFEMTERSGVTTAEFILNEKRADHVKMITYRDADSVLEDLDARVPLVQVASTTAGDLEVDPFEMRFVVGNRLYLPTATWFQTVSMLIAIASQIIVWADELTPALSKELDELIAQGRTDDTVILLEPHKYDVETLAYLPRRPGEVLTSDHRALAPFPNPVDCATLKGGGVADCPELVRLVQRLHQVAQQPVGPRLARILRPG